jgi:hypothetical protein
MYLYIKLEIVALRYVATSIGQTKGNGKMKVVFQKERGWGGGVGEH